MKEIKKKAAREQSKIICYRLEKIEAKPTNQAATMATTNLNGKKKYSMVESQERQSKKKILNRNSKRTNNNEEKKKSKIQFVCRRIGDVLFEMLIECATWVWHTQSAE